MYLLVDDHLWLVAGAVDPDRRLPPAHLHRLPRLRPRLVRAERRGNLWIGRFTALLVFQPFANWRHNHAVHHGTSGDLDRRGQGDVETLTVAEYQARDLEGPPRLPRLPQPGDPLHHRPALVADVRPPLLEQEHAPAPDPQRLADQRRALRPRRRDDRGGRPGRLAAGADARRDAGRDRRRLPLLRPAPVRGRLLGDRRELGLRRRRAEGQLLPEAAAGVPLLQRQHRPPPRPPPERQDPQLQPAARPRGEPDLRRRPGPHLRRRRCARCG